jgi:hypothetical protein
VITDVQKLHIAAFTLNDASTNCSESPLTDSQDIQPSLYCCHLCTELDRRHLPRPYMVVEDVPEVGIDDLCGRDKNEDPIHDGLGSDPGMIVDMCEYQCRDADSIARLFGVSARGCRWIHAEPHRAPLCSPCEVPWVPCHQNCSRRCTLKLANSWQETLRVNCARRRMEWSERREDAIKIVWGT